MTVLSCIGQDGDRPAGLRNRRLLSVGMASAIRRSKLVALDITRLRFGEISV